jgi:hypothetical protein
MLAESGLLEFLQLPSNLVFVIPLLLGLVLFTLQLVGFGLSGGHDVDADHDVDVDHDIDVDHDVDVDHEVDVDHDVDADHDVDHDLDAGHGFAVGDVLRFLNVGRVPFMVVLQSVLLSVGLFGLVASFVLAPRLPAGVPLLAATVPIGTIVGLLFSKVLTNFIARMAPTIETKDNRLSKLVGAEVTVESAQVDDKQGRGAWKDAAGHLITVYIRTAPGAPPISKGAIARLESFEPIEKVFVCVASSGTVGGTGRQP